MDQVRARPGPPPEGESFLERRFTRLRQTKPGEIPTAQEEELAFLDGYFAWKKGQPEPQPR